MRHKIRCRLCIKMRQRIRRKVRTQDEMEDKEGEWNSPRSPAESLGGAKSATNATNDHGFWATPTMENHRTNRQGIRL